MSLVFQQVRLPLADFTLALDSLALSGRVTAIFGPSGAGKTSLLELVTGLRRPTTGRVTLDGRVLADADARLHLPPPARRLGYVPQDGALFPHLDVRRNLLYGAARAQSGPPDQSAPPRPSADLTLGHVAEVLEIAPLLDRAVDTLSGGEKQRVALGRALLSAPRLLLLDEPLAGLDLSLKDRLLPHLRRVRDEFCIPMLYVTHSPDEVVALCDEVLMLERGRVAGQGAPGLFFERDERPRHRRRDAAPDGASPRSGERTG